MTKKIVVALLSVAIIGASMGSALAGRAAWAGRASSAGIGSNR